MADTGKTLKTIAANLKALSKEINSIAIQVGKATKTQSKRTSKIKPVKKAAKAKTPRKSTPKKPAPSPGGTVSNVDTVFEAIKNADGGINNASIIEKTGLAKKQVANVVFKLKKQNKIKAVSRGVFTIA
jgi:hypothetical protein